MLCLGRQYRAETGKQDRTTIIIAAGEKQTLITEHGLHAFKFKTNRSCRLNAAVLIIRLNPAISYTILPNTLVEDNNLYQ